MSYIRLNTEIPGSEGDLIWRGALPLFRQASHALPMLWSRELRARWYSTWTEHADRSGGWHRQSLRSDTHLCW